MNDNNFDSSRSEQEQNESRELGGFEVYSKQYMPSENGYTEQKQTYSTGAMPATPPKKRRGRGRKALIVVAITLSALLATALMVLMSAAMLTAYRNLPDVEWEIRTDADESLDAESDILLPDPDDPAETEENSDLLFSSDEETEIKKSESNAVTTDGKVGDEDLSMADVVALVADSVVEITTSETLRNGLVYESGAGSGVIVNESGVIITNHHVISAGTDISVRLTNGNVYEAAVVASDADSDIAILKIEPRETLTVAQYCDSDSIVVGEEVLAIGNPLGILGGTVTNGIVSALGREVTVEGETMTLLQHNAAISPGNSGGALFNMRGELIGIVNAKYSSSGAEGLGFAIPMNTVIEVYDDLITYGYVKGRPDHGLTLTTDRYYIFQGYVYIYTSLYTDELRYGDRVISIDGETPTTVDEAYALLDQYEIGDTVSITVVRNNKQVTVDLEIREYAPQE